MIRLPTLRLTFQRWDALTFATLMRLALSTVIGIPVFSALLATDISQHPDGDPALFQTGGMMLTEAVRISLHGLGPLTKLTMLLTVVGVLASLLPLSVLLVAFANRTLPFAGALAQGFARLPALFAIYGLYLLLQVLVLAGTLVLAVRTASELHSALGDPGADLFGFLVLGLGVALSCFIGIARDLSFAAATGSNRSAWRSAVVGAGALLSHPLRVGIDWARFAAWQCVFVLGAAWLVGLVPIEQGGASSGLFALALHAGVLFLVIVMRAAWSVRTLAHANADAVL